SYDSVSGRFNATLAAGGEGPHAQRVSISGRTFRTISLPVLRGSVSPGDVIRRQDIEWLSIREDRVSRDVVTDANRLVGTTPRVRLRPGEPIRDNDTRPPVLVTRNSSVMIVLQMPNMTLTAQGRAIEDGAKGDVIRVTNLQSKKVIEATVNGPDMVTVIVGPRLSLN
ncbi:MAG: flagellar basal body P-ring formation protein FlgA, partial [Rhodospirillales bacterium]|nr:flagellar basal body P-ring formation protein FlgA [Rhodospirillales bacterium]